MRKNITLLAMLLLFGQLCLFSQNTIKIGINDLEMNYLKEGRNQYLVYIEKPDKSIIDMSIWERKISFSKCHNEDVIIIEQNWKNQDTIRQRYVYSINKRENFQSIYHYSKSGKGKIDAFNFYQDKIIGADSVMNNSKKDFLLTLKQPTLNWELDLETFRLLPFEKGKNFQINFYHPGGKSAPKFYNYNVIGEEEIKDVSGNSINCWLLKISYDENSYATYWIAKNNREVVKMVEQFNGIKRYKIKLL